MTHRLLPADHQPTPAGFDDLVKVAGTRLSTDARLWQTEIVAQLAAAHPYLPAEDLSVEFNRIDPVKGAAVGSVKVGSTGVTIPVVIARKRTGSDPELAPTDIFYVDGGYRPLTEEAVKSAMLSREIGEPLAGAARGRATGGNPYIGDLTGDASPLEFAGQVSPAAGPFATKTSAFDPKKMSDAAKGAIMAGIGGAGLGATRGVDNAHREAQRLGRPVTIKDKVKHIASGALTGGAIGATAGGAAGMAAKTMGIESPHVRRIAKTSSVRELAEGVTFSVKTSSTTGLCETLVKNANIHPNDLANFRALLAGNPQVLQGAAATNLRMVDMILKHKAPSAPVPGTKITRPNVMVLVKDPLTGLTRVKFTGGPSETVSSEAELKSMLGDRYTEAKDALRQHGAYVVTEDVQQVTWDAARQARSGAKPVERDGMYAIRDRNGGTAMGHVCLQMIRPNGTTVPMRLFVSTEGRYAVSPELFGVRVGGSNRLPSSQAKKADHGVFVTYVNGTPIASTPVIIESVSRLTSGPDGVKGDDFVAYNVRDPMNGEQMSLVPSRSAQSFVRLREIDSTKMALTRGDIYLMPADVDWVKFTGRIDVAKSADQIVKVSSTSTVTKVAFIDGGFHVEHGAEAWRDLDDAGAMELLAGMGVAKTAEIVDICRQARSARGDGVELVGLHEPQLVSYSVKQAEEASYPLMERLTKAMRPTSDMLKAAAAAGDDQALDMVLGLNFITPQNVRLFTDSIDQFDEVASKLAGLLLASRLGLQHVREDAVKEAMEGIARTSEQLRLLQSAAQFKRQQALGS